MSASCEMQASPSALSAVLGNTGARWCGSSFPHCYTDMLFLAASGKNVLAAYPLPPPPPHRRRCEAEASQQLSPAMSFTSAQMEYWQRGGTGVCGAAQQRPRRLCDRRTYFIYVGLRCAAAAAAVFFFLKKRTDSPRSSFSIRRQERSTRSDSARWLSVVAPRVEDHL